MHMIRWCNLFFLLTQIFKWFLRTDSLCRDFKAAEGRVCDLSNYCIWFWSRCMNNNSRWILSLTNDLLFSFLRSNQPTIQLRSSFQMTTRSGVLVVVGMHFQIMSSRWLWSIMLMKREKLLSFSRLVSSFLFLSLNCNSSSFALL